MGRRPAGSRAKTATERQQLYLARKAEKAAAEKAALQAALEAAKRSAGPGATRTSRPDNSERIIKVSHIAMDPETIAMRLCRELGRETALKFHQALGRAIDNPSA
jgi:hypothetical protein